MKEIHFNPDLPTPETLAGINVEMQGKKDLAVRPARLNQSGVGGSPHQQPDADRLAGINVSFGENRNKQ